MKKLKCECGMDDCFPGCGCEILSILGKKWSAYIIMHLLENEVMKFNEFLSNLNQISPKTLSSRLKELEKLNIIHRKVKPTTPVKIEYMLSENGRELGHLLKQLKNLCHTWKLDSLKNS